jgi:hypothetical protein
MSEPTNYLGEVMVHKYSRQTGPVVRAGRAGKSSATQLTLKTYDGVSVKGPASDFKFANGPEYLSFIEGWLSDVQVSMY